MAGRGCPLYGLLCSAKLGVRLPFAPGASTAWGGRHSCLFRGRAWEPLKHAACGACLCGAEFETGREIRWVVGSASPDPCLARHGGPHADCAQSNLAACKALKEQPHSCSSSLALRGCTAGARGSRAVSRLFKGRWCIARLARHRCVQPSLGERCNSPSSHGPRAAPYLEEAAPAEPRAAMDAARLRRRAELQNRVKLCDKNAKKNPVLAALRCLTLQRMRRLSEAAEACNDLVTKGYTDENVPGAPGRCASMP